MAEREELILEVKTELQQARADIERLESQLTEIEGKTVEVDLTADDQASPIVDSVAQDVETLDGATASSTLAVDDLASEAIDEVEVGISDLDGASATATIEVDDEATDVVEEALESLEDIEDTFTATIETEGADAASEAVGGIAEGLGEIAGGQGLAALSAAGFLAIGRNAADAVLDVKALALATGSSLDEASRLKEAWEQAGGSMDTLERNVIRANASIRESPALANSLGIEISENTSAYQVFTGAVNALNSGQLTATERLDLAMQVFGSRGVLILNDLQTRVGDLDAFMAQVGDNEIITQEQVDQAVAFEQSWDAVTDAMTAIGREILPAVAASAERIAGALESWPIENLIGGFEVMGAQVSIIEAALGAGGGNVADTLVEVTEALTTLLGLGRDEITFPLIEAWSELKADLADNGEIDTATDALELLAAASSMTGEEVLAAAGGLEALDPAAASAASSIRDVEQALQDFDDQQLHTNELWNVVIADIRDGNGLTQQGTDAWNRLREMLGKTDLELSAIADQKIDEELRAEAAAADAAAEAQRKHAEAIQETVSAFEEYLAGFDPAASRLAGFNAALESMNRHFSELDASQQTIDFVEAMRGVSGAISDAVEAGVDLEGLDIIPDTWGEVLAMPEELGAVNDAIVGFRDTMQSEFAQAFEQGGASEARQWAADTKTAIENELRESGELTEAQVQEIVTSLGLLPDQVETTIRISESEQARQILSDIGGLIESIPPSVQRQVALEIIAGDPEAALAIVQDSLNSAPAPVVTVGADTTEATDAIATAAEETPTATITAEADTAAAATALLDEADRPRIAYIIADALVGIAQGELDDLTNADRTAYIDVATGSVDVPSAFELARRIGRVRVPVDAYWSGRIEGSRPR